MFLVLHLEAIVALSRALVGDVGTRLKGNLIPVLIHRPSHAKRGVNVQIAVIQDEPEDTGVDASNKVTVAASATAARNKRGHRGR